MLSANRSFSVKGVLVVVILSAWLCLAQGSYRFHKIGFLGFAGMS